MIDAVKLYKMIREGGIGCIVQAKLMQENEKLIGYKVPASIEGIVDQYSDIFAIHKDCLQKDNVITPYT